MSVLELISSLKWPIVVLVVVGYCARTVEKHPDFGTWLKAWIDRRNINAQVTRNTVADDGLDAAGSRRDSTR